MCWNGHITEETVSKILNTDFKCEPCLSKLKL